MVELSESRPLIPASISEVPNTPGVHVVEDSSGEVVYVGRSSNQRTRLQQHLTGDRQASVLHKYVGEMLDEELRREATRDEIRNWLMECTFRYAEIEDTEAAKAELVNRYSPKFNRRTSEDRVGRSSDTDEDAWDVFIRWGRRFYESDAFDSAERDYKLELAGEMQAALDAVFRGDPDWPTSLRRAFRSTNNNLSRWSQHDPYLDWVDAHTDEARLALQLLERGDPVSVVDEWMSMTPNEAIPGPGARAMMFSLLALGVDATRFPPYKPSIVEKAARLVGLDHGGSDSKRYRGALDFFGQIYEQAHQRGLHLRDLLDAQAVMWSVIRADLDSFSDAERAELARYRGDVRPVWWVNQGKTYAQERQGGYVWAPQEGKGGVRFQHWVNVSKIEKGDILLSYANGSIRSIGLARSKGRSSPRPTELGETWEQLGWQADVRYFDLERPISLNELPQELRLKEEPCFNKNGGVNQGYMYPLSDTFADAIRRQFGDRWPDESPWSGEPPDNQALRALVVYVGNAAMENLAFGLDHQVWGWKEMQDDYSEVRPGDVFIFGSGYTGGSPRTTAENFATHALNRVIRSVVTTPIREEADPLWPDETRSGELIYSYRIGIGDAHEMGALSVDELNAHFGADVGEALRMSAVQGGRGVMIEISPQQSAPTIDISDVSLADVCAAAEQALRASGLDYGARHQDLVRSFMVSLATKRLVLLTGLSGSGKTRLGLAFGQWLGRDRYKVVAVRPDWTGPDALLGYENQLSVAQEGGHAWVVPETLRFMLRAAKDPSHPYLLLLDEMNLAHVERYFADVLSGIESREDILPNLVEANGEWRAADKHRLPLPDNLFVVGTVNIDETTYMFSPKVLDRANTLEFRVLAEDLKSGGTGLTKVTPGDESLVARFLHDSLNGEAVEAWDSRESMAEALVKLHRILSHIDREFGHRVFQEALRFGALLAAAGEDDWMTALDLQVMQKVLPRFHGSVKQIAEPLRLLASWCFYGPGSQATAEFDPQKAPEGEPALPVSFDKIVRMYRRVLANHFVSFAE